jgi:hypothetical protein
VGVFNLNRSQVRELPLPGLYSKKQITLLSSLLMDLRMAASEFFVFLEGHFKSF